MSSPSLSSPAPSPGLLQRMVGAVPPYLPGLLLTGVLALASMWLAQQSWLAQQGISALTLAIVLGMVLGNSVYGRLAGVCAPGVQFSKQRLLRLGIVLYGVRLTVHDMAQIGVTGVVVDAVMLCSTFALALWAGKHLFKLDHDTVVLIGAGSSICGAAAVMATEPVLNARTEKVTVAVATVVVFGTLGLFLYPMLYHWLAPFPAMAMTELHYGVYVGSTVHEVAQVVAAGRAVGEQAADAAVVTKMVRVMMLAPFLVLLSTFVGRKSKSHHTVPTAQMPAPQRSGSAIVIPWFAVWFIGVMLLNSTVSLPRPTLDALNTLDTVLLAMAMAGLGLTTHVSALRQAGIRPLALASLLFVWLVVGGGLVNQMI